jgi:hypothetical protein
VLHGYHRIPCQPDVRLLIQDQVHLFDKNKSVSILNILHVVKHITGQPQVPCRFVHINAKTLITRSYLFRSWARLALVNPTCFAQPTIPDRKSKIVPVKKCGSFNLGNCLAYRYRIMRVNQKDILVSFDHFSTFFIGCIPGTAFYGLIEKVFTSPSALQYHSDVKEYIIRGDKLGITHFEVFCHLDVLIKLRHFYSPLAKTERPALPAAGSNNVQKRKTAKVK